jgi:hypothetical protein
LGAYQGHGGAQPITFGDGAISAVTLERFAALGY